MGMHQSSYPSYPALLITVDYSRAELWFLYLLDFSGSSLTPEDSIDSS
jgi:hypothetical protein